MKKTLLTVLIASALVAAFALVGCSNQQPAAEPAADSVSTQPAEQAAASAEQAAAPAAAPAEQSGQITEDQAKQAAFADAGVTEADVTNLRVHLETDDGITKYEVDFNVGTTEYDYDIDPATGAILDKGIDLDDDGDDADDAYDD